MRYKQINVGKCERVNNMNAALLSSKKMDWCTPIDFFEYGIQLYEIVHEKISGVKIGGEHNDKSGKTIPN